jgi:CelD/BcsL family acetyltransferase involved in cellulose biosynthesis
MNAIARPWPEVLAGQAASTPAQAFAGLSVHDGVAGLAAEFRALEALPGHTPYQSARWLAAFAAAMPDGGAARFVLLRDGAGQATALFPLQVSGGLLKVARFLGDKQANFHMPLWHPAAAATLDAAAMRTLLLRVGRAIGVDAFALTSQPESWQGLRNPLALLPRTPSPSFGQKLTLTHDCEATIRQRFSSDSLGKLRRKEKRLAEIGPLRYVRAATPAEALALLDAFLAQKAARFAAQGIANPFADARAQAFLRAGVQADPSGGEPAIVMQGLLAGDRVLATYGAAIGRDRYSGMFTSFDSDREVARFSPGDLLLMHIVRQCCRRGLATFDLGVGEASYKDNYCDEPEPLFDTAFAVTPLGHLAAAGLQAKQGMKRRIKQSPRLMALVGRLRRARAR